MERTELIAAWLGAFGLITGAIVFGVFVLPSLLDYYGLR